MCDKKYLELHSQEQRAVWNLGDQLADELFRLLAESWTQLSGSHAFDRVGTKMSGPIACDHIEVIANRNSGPYSQPGWLDEWQETYSDGRVEVIVIARTAKWWYDQIANGAIVPSNSLSIDILASDPMVDRRLLAHDDRSEFSHHLDKILKDFAKVSRKFETFNYALAPALVLDSFTLVKSSNDTQLGALIILDLYTGTRYDGPRPQIAFQHTGFPYDGHDCIVSRLERRARRMLASGGKDLTGDDATAIAKPFKRIEEEPSRRDSPGRLANYALPAFEFYDSISNSIQMQDDIEPALAHVPAPVCVQIEVTDRCIVNRCLGCSRGLKTDPIDMSVDVYKRLVQDLSGMGTKSIVISGGEPLIHPQIEEILTFAKEMDMSVAVLTDGLALSDNETLVDVVGETVSSLRISVDGFSADSYRKIRQLNATAGDPIERVERGISRVAGARRDPSAKLEHIGVCMTLFRSNVAQIDSARQWVANQDGIDSLVFKFAHGTPDTVSRTRSRFTCSVQDIVTARAKISEEIDWGSANTVNTQYVKTYVDTMSPEAIASGQPTSAVYDERGAVCFTPVLFSLVDPSGGVYICCHTYYDNSNEHEKRKDLLFGNVTTRRFSDIWDKTAFQRVNKIHEWNRQRNAFICTCPMRNECTRHWKHNELMTQSFDGYRRSSLSGRKMVAEEIDRLADTGERPFWL